MTEHDTNAYGMLTPAVAAYGLPIVIVMLLFIAACVAFVVYDFRRYSRQVDDLARARAMRRHPAGRHRRHSLPPADDRPTVQIPAVRSHRPRHP